MIDEKLSRLNKLIKLDLYMDCYNEIEKFEEDRIFCRHDFSHFLDVARLSLIYNISENLNLSQEILYTTAFLHDIGRGVQYKENTPHNIASVDISREMLEISGYNDEEISSISFAILNHESFDKANNSNDALSKVLYKADKKSRNCFMCKAENMCKWSLDKKNMKIVY